MDIIQQNLIKREEELRDAVRFRFQKRGINRATIANEILNVGLQRVAIILGYEKKVPSHLFPKTGSHHHMAQIFEAAEWLMKELDI